MLTYEFMRIAFVAAILLGIAIPLSGSQAVYKRLSSSGDALAHSSLAGVAIGLAAGLNPTLISIIACVLSFLLIELLRKKFSKYSEIGVAVVLSAAIGIAGILSSYTSSYSFDSYLFGSILLIEKNELWILGALALITVVFTILTYGRVFACLYSEDEAKVNGIRVNALNFFMDLLLSISIALGAKIVGSLVVSSLVVLPTAIALQFKRGYRFTLIAAVMFSVLSMCLGLTIAYYTDWKPGGTIVLVAIAFLALAMVYRFISNQVAKRRARP